MANRISQARSDKPQSSSEFMEKPRTGLFQCTGSRPILRRLLFAFVFVIAVAAIGIGSRYLPDLDWVIDREDSLRRSIATAPFFSFFVGLFFYFCLSLIPGTAGKSIVFGWLFGLVKAFLIVEIGLTAAAILSFLVGRYLVKQLVHRRWQIYLRWASNRFDRDGAFYLLWLRLAHAPFTLVNYGAGATNVPLSTFWWTTHVGILPATLVYTFAGSRIPTLRTVVEKGAWAIVDAPLVIVLIITAFLPFFFTPWLRRKFR